ncbi:MAG: amino acid permease [Acidobacteriota bacterium]
MSAPQELLRRLGAWDAALITIGSVIGTGIFLTTGDMAKAMPHTGLVLLVWVVSGLLTLTGALTYAELGAMYPRAGGMYVFLREAYGPLWGFLYGWGAFLVIMSGGIAAIAVGFGEYLGAFLPFWSTQHEIFSVPLGSFTWSVSGGQLAATLAILVLTAINHFGVKEGVAVQNLLTILKVGAIAAFVGIGLLVPAKAVAHLTAPLPQLPAGHVGWLAAFGVAMIAALWTYDGWYGATFSAGEMKNPGRNLPIGLITGTLTIIVLYTLLNLVYFRALPLEGLAATSRVGETAATALFGINGGRLLTAAVLVSTFGCLSSTLLYSSRIYQPMAEDGLFFQSMARIHPRYRVPTISLWTQSGWAILLALSGRYDQLYTYVVFVAVLFHMLTGASVFVLRKKHPDAPRPYRVWGYPVVPLIFMVSSGILVVNTLSEKPVESLFGLGLLALGLPAYFYWRKSKPQS